MRTARLGDCTAGTEALLKSNVERYFLFAQPDTNMQHFTAQSLSQLRCQLPLHRGASLKNRSIVPFNELLTKADKHNILYLVSRIPYLISHILPVRIISGDSPQEIGQRPDKFCRKGVTGRVREKTITGQPRANCLRRLAARNRPAPRQILPQRRYRAG